MVTGLTLEGFNAVASRYGYEGHVRGAATPAFRGRGRQTLMLHVHRIEAYQDVQADRDADFRCFFEDIDELPHLLLDALETVQSVSRLSHKVSYTAADSSIDVFVCNSCGATGAWTGGAVDGSSVLCPSCFAGLVQASIENVGRRLTRLAEGLNGEIEMTEDEQHEEVARAIQQAVIMRLALTEGLGELDDDERREYIRGCHDFSPRTMDIFQIRGPRDGDRGGDGR